MTIIIRCDSCKQDVVIDETTKHVCTACSVNRDPKMWQHGCDCALSNSDSNE